MVVGGGPAAGGGGYFHSIPHSLDGARPPEPKRELSANTTAHSFLDGGHLCDDARPCHGRRAIPKPRSDLAARRESASHRAGLAPGVRQHLQARQPQCSLPPLGCLPAGSRPHDDSGAAGAHVLRLLCGERQPGAALGLHAVPPHAAASGGRQSVGLHVLLLCAADPAPHRGLFLLSARVARIAVAAVGGKELAALGGRSDTSRPLAAQAGRASATRRTSSVSTPRT